ncbi:MAG: PLP-dependent aminotransferase family protein [Acidobacteria bacterium]|nr:PLP-dependent aminotransferase family protein [Acidobacteriota bacterium]
MVFQLNRQTGEPLYRQIKNRISQWIQDGTLGPKDRLPATRDLARSLAVNRHTVVKAYEELEVEGKVHSGVGQGTFVAQFISRPARAPQPVLPVEPAEFEGLWGASARVLERASLSALFLHLPLRRDGVTALSSCLPDIGSFPMREFRNCAYYALQNYGAGLLDLGPTQGFPPFLEQLPKYLLRHGLEVDPGHILITGGIQQGIDLVARTLLNPGDTVITEEVTYPGAISVFRSLGVELVGIPLDAHGMNIDTLEKVLAWRKPKLLYTIPTFHNPTGTTMSAERRRRLLDLAARHKFPILEDQYANDLRLEGPAVLPLAALDRQGWVIAVGSLSKVLFHGLRVGWILSRLEPVRRRVVALKQAADLQTNYLVQGIILEFMRRGYLEKYLKRRLTRLRSRRDAMRRAMREYVPPPAWWYEIEGGVCYWVTLPAPWRAGDVLLEARRRGVVFAPKDLFSVGASVNDAMRWGFTDQSEEHSLRAVRLIGQILRKQSAGVRVPATPQPDYAQAPV